MHLFIKLKFLICSNTEKMSMSAARKQGIGVQGGDLNCAQNVCSVCCQVHNKIIVGLVYCISISFLAYAQLKIGMNTLHWFLIHNHLSYVVVHTLRQHDSSSTTRMFDFVDSNRQCSIFFCIQSFALFNRACSQRREFLKIRRHRDITFSLFAIPMC